MSAASRAPFVVSFCVRITIQNACLESNLSNVFCQAQNSKHSGNELPQPRQGCHLYSLEDGPRARRKGFMGARTSGAGDCLDVVTYAVVKKFTWAKKKILSTHNHEASRGCPPLQSLVTDATRPKRFRLCRRFARGEFTYSERGRERGTAPTIPCPRLLKSPFPPTR